MARVPGCEAVYDVANQWRERCLESDGSLLWPDLEEPTWTMENLAVAKSRLAQFNPETFTTIHQLSELILVSNAPIQKLLIDLAALWAQLKSSSNASHMSAIENLIVSSALPHPSEAVLETLVQALSSVEQFDIDLSPNPHALRSELLFTVQLTIDAKRKIPFPLGQNAWESFAATLLHDFPKATDTATQLMHLMFPESIDPVNQEQGLSIVEAFVPADDRTDYIYVDLRIARTHARSVFNRQEFSFFDSDVFQVWGGNRENIEGERSFWWVNQGASFERERSGGYIFASGYSSSGAELRHHHVIKELKVGDLVLHYAQSAIRSVGRVTSPVPDNESRNFQARIDYYDLHNPISLSEIPKDLRTNAERPFDRAGGVKQQYLFPLSHAWFKAFWQTFADRWPEGLSFPFSSLFPSTDNEVASACFLTEHEIGTIQSLLKEKRQLIFEGPPGTGKTYTAKLFARYLAGLPLVGPTDPQVEIVQFHQSYGYEDFVAGIRPSTTTEGTIRYYVQPGIFIEMCKRAEANPERNFVLIIDEINRGNVSRIFGELLYALEYRDEPVRLQYPDLLGDVDADHLTIPKNLFLIGTMNSTDRSLAMIDYALRRRFFFWKLRPVVDREAPVLAGWMRSQSFSAAIIDDITNRFVRINEQVSALLNPDYAIGHSYFMDRSIGERATRERIWKYALQPLLEEYFHSRRDRDGDIATLRALMLDD